MSAAVDWVGGAAKDIWGGVTGQTNYKAQAYDPAKIAAAQDPWQQKLAAASQYTGEQPYQSALSVDAAELNRTQQPIYNEMAARAAGFDPNRAATQLEAVSGQYGQDVTRQAGGIESLAGEVARAPSYADAASNAAMDRASTEALARASSARGANAALQMREAAAANAGAARLAASEAGALKAREMNDRFATRGDLLARAAGVTGQGAATQGQLYGAAGQARQSGMQAGVDAFGNIAEGRRADAGQVMQAHTAAGQLGQQAQNTRVQAAQAGLDGATAGQQIAAGSHDSTNETNAGVQKTNATNKREAVGGMMKMISDIRAKEDIEPTVTPRIELASQAYRQRLDDVYQGDNDGPWGRPTTSLPIWSAEDSARDGNAGMPITARGRISDYDDSGERSEPGGDDGLDLDLPLLAKLGMMSDERSKRSVNPIVHMALSPDGNREALDPVKPYSYRYKSSFARAVGEDTERRPGVMAQELERSEAGREVVNDGPGLKSLDRDKALSFSLAGVAGLDKRLQRLERAAGARRAA